MHRRERARERRKSVWRRRYFYVVCRWWFFRHIRILPSECGTSMFVKEKKNIFDALFACLTQLTCEQNVWNVDHSNWEWSSKTHHWKDVCFCHIKGIHRIRTTFSWGRITRAYVQFHWGECTRTEKNRGRERKRGGGGDEKAGINELERDAESRGKSVSDCFLRSK